MAKGVLANLKGVDAFGKVCEPVLNPADHLPKFVT